MFKQTEPAKPFKLSAANTASYKAMNWRADRLCYDVNKRRPRPDQKVWSGFRDTLINGCLPTFRSTPAFTSFLHRSQSSNISTHSSFFTLSLTSVAVFTPSTCSVIFRFNDLVTLLFHISRLAVTIHKGLNVWLKDVVQMHFKEWNLRLEHHAKPVKCDTQRLDFLYSVSTENCWFTEWEPDRRDCSWGSRTLDPLCQSVTRRLSDHLIKVEP